MKKVFIIVGIIALFIAIYGKQQTASGYGEIEKISSPYIIVEGYKCLADGKSLHHLQVKDYVRYNYTRYSVGSFPIWETQRKIIYK